MPPVHHVVYVVWYVRIGCPQSIHVPIAECFPLVMLTHVRWVANDEVRWRPSSCAGVQVHLIWSSHRWIWNHPACDFVENTWSWIGTRARWIFLKFPPLQNGIPHLQRACLL